MDRGSHRGAQQDNREGGHYGAYHEGRGDREGERGGSRNTPHAWPTPDSFSTSLWHLEDERKAAEAKKLQQQDLASLHRLNDNCAYGQYYTPTRMSATHGMIPIGFEVEQPHLSNVSSTQIREAQVEAFNNGMAMERERLHHAIIERDGRLSAMEQTIEQMRIDYQQFANQMANERAAFQSTFGRMS